ncbi:MAG: glycoside hydrolase family 65 protein [Geminicoccaceae bacterium]
MSEWSFVFDGFDPEQERLREALCVLGNGYIATRGAAPESAASDWHYPGTYLAGGYNRLTTEIAGRVIENEDLVNLPNWLPLAIRIDGAGWFDLHKVEILGYRQELDLRHGILHRWIHCRDAKGQETRIDQRRLMHMANPHLAAIETMIEAVNWSGRIEIHSGLDGRVVNAGVARYASLSNKHLEPLGTQRLEDDVIVLSARTNQSMIEIAEAARTHALLNGERIDVGHRIEHRRDHIADTFALDLKLGDRLTVEKIVAIHTSRDHAIASPSLAAATSARRAPSFAELLTSHAHAWAELWGQFEVDMTYNDHEERDLEGRRILRLHTFHLLQTASPHVIDLDVGIPARGLHGEAYRGHIFWDELFIFPVINLRIPSITCSLLKYRYRRLDEAKVAAREAGLAGAMYPWQSGSDGREETQQLHLNPKSGRWLPDNSRLQRHVNLAIAYNIWQYYQATWDLEFMAYYGAEMLFEIARFVTSLTNYNDGLERYEIKGVMGPDEYHDGYPDAEQPGVDNNAYTNVMVAWCLGQALAIIDHLPPTRLDELCRRMDLSRAEFDRWHEISRRMRVVFHDDGIISQFEGYEALDEFDWEGYRAKHDDIQRLDRILEAEGDTPNRYKVSKQADVLMLFYLFSAEELAALFDQMGYDFDPATIPANVEYYTQRTSHGSTLSRVVHGWVLYRSDRERAWQLLREALYSDVADTQGGTTAEGVHLGAMAGTVDAVLRIFTGVETRDDVLWLNPFLPEDLKELRLRLRYRGNQLRLILRQDEIDIAADKFPALTVTIGCRDQLFELKPGSSQRISL